MLRVGESGAVAEASAPGGMGERAQTRLSSKCPELGDLLLEAEGGGEVDGTLRPCLAR